MCLKWLTYFCARAGIATCYICSYVSMWFKKEATYSLFSLILIIHSSFAVNAQPDSTNHHFRVKGFPIVYYTPETRWAGGVAGVATFY